MALRLTLCSFNQSIVILEILQLKVKYGNGVDGVKLMLFLTSGKQFFLYVAQFKGEKMDQFIPDTENTTLIVFDKSISEKFSSNIKTGNMVSSHPLCSAMKNRFEIFVKKYLCQKAFGRLLLSQCLYHYRRKFFKGVFEKFQFKVCFQSLGIKSIMSLCIISWLTLERPCFF